MENKNDPKRSKNEAQEILKRIQKQSSEQKRKKTMDMLQGRTKPITQKKTVNDYLELIKKAYNDQTRKMFRKWSNPQNQKMIWLTGFLMVSSYLCYIIEAKYDAMRKKSTTTKTFKQAQIERENMQIQKFLSKGQFEAVPIRDEPVYKNSYKFEEEDDNSFSTRDDFLLQIVKEHQQGIDVDPLLLNQAKKRGLF